MSGHTKGPWQVVGNASVASSIGRPIVHGSNLSVTSTDEQVRADARLIATAPDMLEALRAYADADLHSNKSPREVSDLRDKARAIIRRATGEGV